MEASQTPTVALPYTITVKVLRANRLQGRKPSFQSYVKVEVDGTVLGESEMKLKDASENVFHYDFSCSFQCSREPQAIAELARKLVIVTVSDFLPDERKADARTAVLGQAVLDLLPFLHGQTKFSSRVPLHSGPDVQTKGWDNKAPILQSSQDAGASDELVRKAVLKWRKPTLDVKLDVSEALMSSVDLTCSNLLRVTVETAFSVPEAWTQPAGSSPTSSSYTAALELPVSTQNNQMLVFSDGALKAGGSREEEGRPKKRPFLPQLLPVNTALPGASVEPTPIEQEDGELTGRGDRLFREEAETKKSRVSWDVEMSCFLSGEATNRLRDTITKCRLWPVEIMRSAANAKMLPEENPDIPFHGVAFVDMGRLLFPGATRIRGAYCVQPFTENLLSDKAKRSVSVLKEHAKAVVVTARGASAAVTGKKGAGNKGAARKPVQSRVDAGADGATDIAAEMVNLQGNLYLDARTYILVEISLEKPLVPKTSPEELSRRVMALIPPKPPVTPGPPKAEEAVQSFHQQVSNMVQIVSEQVDELYGADGKVSEVNNEDLKAQVMAELNLSSRYFSFKEPLKRAVERLARDKMPGSDLINDPRVREEFVCNLYVYLVDEMHVGLNKILSEEEEVDTSEEFHLSPSQVRHFTKEAQSIGDYELALQHCLEVLMQNPKDPQSLFDLGSHYMLTEDYMKARACFYEALAIDPIHQPSLIMCGVLAFLFENYTAAQTFLEQAATMDDHGVVAWTILGLLHESQEDEILSEGAFLEANKLLKAEESNKLKEVLKHCSELLAEKTAEEPQEAVTQAASPPPPEEQDQAERRSLSAESEEEDPDSSHEAKSSESKPLKATQRPNIYTETVSFLLQNNALQMAERALAQELLCPEGGYTVSYLLHLARLQLRRGENASAMATLEEALHHNDENAEAWALKGHCYLLQGAPCRARESYECSLSFQPTPADPHLVLLRLGTICQEAGQFEQAKERHLQACEQSPSCLTWLGLGVACYRLGELSLAESALTEANRLNSHNAQVWIYLSFICLKSDRLKEAELFHKYAVKFKLQDEELLREYRETYEVASFSHLSHLFEDRTGASQV